MSDIAAEIAVLATQWNDAVLAHADGDKDVPDSVLLPGASEEQLAALEARLGTSLPPSYRAFLALSNGAWAKPGWGLLVPTDELPVAGLLTTSHVGWVDDLDPEFVEIWSEDADAYDDSVSDEDYLDYSDEQDPCDLHRRDIRQLLMVSCFDWGAAVFLNPRVIRADGEWQAWEFANTHPGAFRYGSFGDLLRHEPIRMAREDAQQAAAAAARLTAGDAQAVLAAIEAFEGGAGWNEGNHLEALRRVADPLRWFDRLVGLLHNRDVPIVQAALSAIARVDSTQALGVLIAAAQRDPSAPIVSTVMARLVTDPDPEGRKVALWLLETQPHAAHCVPWTDEGKELVWQAWVNTGQPFCLEAVVRRYDRRAVEPLCALLVDPVLDPGTRRELAMAASCVRDPSLVPALMTAVRLGDVHLIGVIEDLIQLDALDEAESLITPESIAANPYVKSRFTGAQRKIGKLRRAKAEAQSMASSPIVSQPDPST